MTFSQRLRVDGVRFKMFSNASFLTDVLDRELRDVVNVTYEPMAGDTVDQDAAVESIRHDMVPGDWTAHLTVAPLTSFESADYWILGTSELGSTTRLA